MLIFLIFFFEKSQKCAFSCKIPNQKFYVERFSGFLTLERPREFSRKIYAEGYLDKATKADKPLSQATNLSHFWASTSKVGFCSKIGLVDIFRFKEWTQTGKIYLFLPFLYLWKKGISPHPNCVTEAHQKAKKTFTTHYLCWELFGSQILLPKFLTQILTKKKLFQYRNNPRFSLKQKI